MLAGERQSLDMSTNPKRNLLMIRHCASPMHTDIVTIGNASKRAVRVTAPAVVILAVGLAAYAVQTWEPRERRAPRPERGEAEAVTPLAGQVANPRDVPPLPKGRGRGLGQRKGCPVECQRKDYRVEGQRTDCLVEGQILEEGADARA